MDAVPHRRRDRRVAAGAAVAIDRRQQRARRLVLEPGAGRPRARRRQGRPTSPSARAGERGSSASACSLRPRSSSRNRPTSSPTAWLARGSIWCAWATSTRPLGLNRSLFDDTRDDTKAFDPVALARLDHLIAALKKRGIYVAVELLSKRRFRADDGVGRRGIAPFRRRTRRPVRPDDRQARLRDGTRACSVTVNPETGMALARRSGAGVGHACRRGVAVRPDRQPRTPCRPRTPRPCTTWPQKTTGGAGPPVLGDDRVGPFQGRLPTRCARTGFWRPSPASRTGGASPSSAPHRPPPGST